MSGASGGDSDTPPTDDSADSAPHGPSQATRSWSSPASIATLRIALEQHAQGNAAGQRQQLRNAIRALCTEAHGHHVPAERVLAELKHMWNTMPGVQSLLDPEARATRVAELVSLCIGEYYADESDSTPHSK